MVSIHLCLLVGESDLSYADLNYTDLDYVGMDWCWIIVARSTEKIMLNSNTNFTKKQVLKMAREPIGLLDQVGMLESTMKQKILH